MYIKINVEKLAKLLRNTAYIVSKLKNNDTLAVVYIKAHEQQVDIIIANTTDKAIISLPCTVLQEGQCFAPAHSFMGSIQSFEGEIEIELISQTLEIRQSKTRFKLPIRTDGTPLLANETFEAQNALTLDGETFNNMITTVLPFKDTVPQSLLSGINIYANNMRIMARSCCNATIGITRYNCETEDGCDINAILQADTLQAIGRLFANEELAISSNGATYCFSGENCTLYTQALAGVFPQVEKLIETKDLQTVFLEAARLKDFLRRISVVKTLDKRLNIHIANSTMSLAYQQLLEDCFDIKGTTQEISLAVNYEYLTNALNALEGKEFRLEITPKHKLRFASANDLIVIAPLC